MKQRFNVGLEVKSVDSDGSFSGYGSIFGNKDSYGDIVVKGAFDKSLQRWKEKQKFPALLWQHKADEPIGVYTEMKEDDRGLYVEGKLLKDDDPLAKRAYGHLKAGSLSGMSIGYMSVDEEYDKKTDSLMLKEVDLWEVSLVTFPANEAAQVESVKRTLMRGDLPREKNIEAILRDAGFSRKQAKAFMSCGVKGLGLRDVDNSLELEAIKKLTQTIKG